MIYLYGFLNSRNRALLCFFRLPKVVRFRAPLCICSFFSMHILDPTVEKTAFLANFQMPLKNLLKLIR